VTAVPPDRFCDGTAEAPALEVEPELEPDVVPVPEPEVSVPAALAAGLVVVVVGWLGVAVATVVVVLERSAMLPVMPARAATLVARVATLARFATWRLRRRGRPVRSWATGPSAGDARRSPEGLVMVASMGPRPRPTLHLR
jgi:hypothetical protein